MANYMLNILFLPLVGTHSMASAAKKRAAARARAAKAARNNKSSKYSTSRAKAPSPEFLPGDPSLEDSDSEDEESVLDFDCGYEGGVDYDCSDYDCSEEDSSDNEWSDQDELIEMTEEDFPPIKPITIPDIFFTSRTSADWRAAEMNRGLGYTGTSKRTKERRDMEARTREKMRKDAKVS